MLLGDLVATSQAVAGTSGRLQKIGHLAALLKQCTPVEIETAVAILSGSPRQGRIGIGFAAIREAHDVPPAESASIQLLEVDAVFAAIAAETGGGSPRRKVALLRDFFSRATRDEQDFLARLLFGELRQGALEGVLADAVARAAGITAARIRRAAMLSGSLTSVARLAMDEGGQALDRLVIQPFQPVQPMLADTVPDVPAALEEMGEAALEYKLDGARIQVHKGDDQVRVYSRSLREVTHAVPEVVAAARALPAQTIVLDGEAISLRPDGTPHPFQITMRRFGRKLDVARLQQELPITPFFFDALYLDGQSLIDEPLSRRIHVLDDIAAPGVRVPRLVTGSAAEGADFARGAVAAGHEGVMAKSLSSLYAAGRRGQSWLKIKQPRTLDLVVLAVEWGSGRRQGTLSNLHLGARDTERGGFVMLGKTFKGLTDEMLAWQTEKLLGLELGREGHVVHVRPELVVEIAFNEIQESPVYQGRLALRFARVKAYRTDKTAADADTYESVRSLYHHMTGVEAPPRA